MEISVQGANGFWLSCMKSIKTPGMTEISESIHYGRNPMLKITGSCWQPTLKERLHILFGGNIMVVFTNSTKHPPNFYLKTSKQKESK